MANVGKAGKSGGRAGKDPAKPTAKEYEKEVINAGVGARAPMFAGKAGKKK